MREGKRNEESARQQQWFTCQTWEEAIDLRDWTEANAGLSRNHRLLFCSRLTDVTSTLHAGYSVLCHFQEKGGIVMTVRLSGSIAVTFAHSWTVRGALPFYPKRLIDSGRLELGQNLQTFLRELRPTPVWALALSFDMLLVINYVAWL